MKFAASLLLLAAFALSTSACAPRINQRAMYNPNKGHGYWTDRLEKKNRNEGIFGISKSDRR